MNTVDQIGPYRIIREIGRGGMGVVYLAEHPTLGIDVALKALFPDPSRSAQSREVIEARKRFENEAVKTAKLSDPRIIDIYDYGVDQETGILYIVMTYLDGGSLKNKIEAKGRLTYDESRPTFLRIARAIDFIHSKGIFHRDIKPSNIMFRSDEAMLADFGIAREVKDTIRTKTGEMAGTIAYSPPEVIDDQEPDHRADIYAFGLVIYETLTGANPFLGSTTTATIKKITTTTSPEIPKDLAPGPVREFVRKSLAKDPADRPDNCAMLIKALEEFPLLKLEQMTIEHKRLEEERLKREEEIRRKIEEEEKLKRREEEEHRRIEEEERKKSVVVEEKSSNSRPVTESEPESRKSRSPVAWIWAIVFAGIVIIVIIWVNGWGMIQPTDQNKGSISGTVYVDGRPQADGTVLVNTADGQLVDSRRCTQTGHYIIQNLDAGTYEVIYMNAMGAPIGDVTVVEVHQGSVEMVDLNLSSEVY